MSVSVTRRGFIAGAAAFAALASASALGGCGDSDNKQVEVLEVPESAVTTLDAFKGYKNADKHCKIKELGTYAKGTLFSTSGTAVAAALCPGDTANPLNTVGLVDLSTGKLTTVLDKAVNDASDYSIYDVTSSDDLLVWVESNFLTSDWAVYCATINAKKMRIGEAVKVDEGNADYDAPQIAAAATTAYWIVQPAEDGSKTSEDSLLKAAAGGSAASTVYTSHGRFNGGLTVSGGVVTAMPRADTSGTYYQLTALQTGTGAILASQVLPRAFRPNSAIYLANGFAFGIEASYDYGDGISNVGTYCPLADGTYLRLTRTPVTAPGTCGGWLFCKSGSRTAFVNLSKRSYFTVDPPDSCEDYGDYPVAVGDGDKVYVYATVSEVVDDKETSKVILRCIEPK